MDMWIPYSIKSTSQQAPVQCAVDKSEIVGTHRSYSGSEKRGTARYPSRLQARFFYGDKVFKGVLRDVSETGMFISTDMTIQLNKSINVMILIDDKILQIPVKIKRTVNSDMNVDSGIGVELINIPQAYLDYTRNVSIHSNTPAFS